MNKKLEKTLILLVDFITINLAGLIYFVVRVRSGMFDLITQPELLLPLLVLYFYWFVIFTFVGMYRTWFASSRFDELSGLFKASFVGIFVLFFVIFYDDIAHGQYSASRYLILIYWGVLLFLVGFGRIIVRSIQRNLLFRGIGRKNAIVVGFNPKANNMHATIEKYRGLGLDIKAYVAVKKENIGKVFNGVKVLDTYQNVLKVADEVNAEEIILALEKHEDDVTIFVIDKCDSKNLGLKIVPDLYGIVSGQARTSQIYGFPLIDIMPQLMPEWEKKVKRIMDVFISLLIILITSPIIILTSIAIKLTSRGPVFYKQDRAGINSKTFKVLKFRSMIVNAEQSTGPVWSSKGDPRITKVGKFIRKVRIDELPQMINVLKGEMSLVGPRPERPFFVEKLAQDIPLYKRRLKVRPGVTGWAQVKHKYDETLEDVKTKLRYDLFYIENMSLSMDLKILFRTVFVVIFGKGHYN